MSCTLKLCDHPFIFHNTAWLNFICGICVKCTVMLLADTFSVSQLTRKCTYHVGGKRLAERLQHRSARQRRNPLEWALNFGGWRICSIKVQRPPTRTEMTIALKSGHFLWAYAPLKPWWSTAHTHTHRNKQICQFCSSQDMFRSETFCMTSAFVCVCVTCYSGCMYVSVWTRTGLHSSALIALFLKWKEQKLSVRFTVKFKLLPPWKCFWNQRQRAQEDRN